MRIRNYWYMISEGNKRIGQFKNNEILIVGKIIERENPQIIDFILLCS